MRVAPDAVEPLALAVTHAEYVAGNIGEDELERRVGAIVGAEGRDRRAEVLAGGVTGYVDVTSLGDPVPRVLPIRWEWPA